MKEAAFFALAVFLQTTSAIFHGPDSEVEFLRKSFNVGFKRTV